MPQGDDGIDFCSAGGWTRAEDDADEAGKEEAPGGHSGGHVGNHFHPPLPWCNRTTRSEKSASSGLWVTKTMVLPSAWSSLKKQRIISSFSSSRLPVGSSA